MNLRSLLILTVVTAALIASAVAWNASLGRQTLRQEIAAAADKRTETTAAARTLETRIAALEAQGQQLQAALEAEKRVAAAAATADPKPVTPASVYPLDNPATRAMAVKQFKAQVALDFAWFYRQRGLTPQQIARFEEVLLTNDDQARDLAASLANHGLLPTDPTAQKMQRDLDERTKAELTELLGAEGYARYTDFYLRERSQREVVKNLVGGLALGSSPLAPAQAHQLGQLLSQRGYVSDLRRSQRMEAITVEAQGFLAPAQVAELRNETASEAVRWQSLTALSSLQQMITRWKTETNR